MDSDRYTDVIAADSAVLVAAGVRAGMDAPVPSCPEWRVADLFAHIGQVQRWAAEMVETAATERAQWGADLPSQDELAPWVEVQTARLLDALAQAGADQAMWTFDGSGRASFWYRRQAHEVVVHRCDAELAAGVAPVVDGDVARDAIDEYFAMFVAGRRRKELIGVGETIHVHCTDGDGEWLVRLTADGPDVRREHAKGDVAARGTASNLLLVLTGRQPRSTVEVFGDDELLERFVDLSRL